MRRSRGPSGVMGSGRRTAGLRHAHDEASQSLPPSPSSAGNLPSACRPFPGPMCLGCSSGGRHYVRSATDRIDRSTCVSESIATIAACMGFLTSCLSSSANAGRMDQWSLSACLTSREGSNTLAGQHGWLARCSSRSLVQLVVLKLSH